MSTTTSSTPSRRRQSFEQLVEENPLGHPIPFTIKYRDVFGHEQAVPPHLQLIDDDAYKAFSEEYPTAPKTLGYIYPRGHGKSETGSGIIPTWKVLRDPNIRILIMMLNTTEAKGKLAKCKGYIEKLAPLYGHSIDESNKKRLTLERDADHSEATIRAAGFDSGVTGGRYDVIIFDDIVDAPSQATQHQRDKAEEQFEDLMKLRADDDTVFILLGTRKHPKDLYRGLIKSGGWRIRQRKAIQDWSIVEDGAYDVITESDIDGKMRRYAASDIGRFNPEIETIIAADPHRNVNVLWPERRPLSKLLVDLHQGFGQRKGSQVWRREMQNHAKALEGKVLSTDMLNWSPSLPGRQSSYVRIAGLDLGVEKDPQKAVSNDTDFWALSILARNVETKQTYLENVYRDRGITMKKAIDWVDGILGRYNSVSKCLVEANQAQDFFVQAARSAGLPVEATSSSGSKEDRLVAMSAMFESGAVKIVGSDDSEKRSEMRTNWVDEWTAFPGGDHDDLLDSTQIALRELTPDENRKQTRVYNIGH